MPWYGSHRAKWKPSDNPRQGRQQSLLERAAASLTQRETAAMERAERRAQDTVELLAVIDALGLSDELEDE